MGTSTLHGAATLCGDRRGRCATTEDLCCFLMLVDDSLEVASWFARTFLASIPPCPRAGFASETATFQYESSAQSRPRSSSRNIAAFQCKRSERSVHLAQSNLHTATCAEQSAQREREREACAKCTGHVLQGNYGFCACSPCTCHIPRKQRGCQGAQSQALCKQLASEYRILGLGAFWT